MSAVVIPLSTAFLKISACGTSAYIVVPNNGNFRTETFTSKELGLEFVEFLHHIGDIGDEENASLITAIKASKLEEGGLIETLSDSGAMSDPEAAL